MRLLNYPMEYCNLCACERLGARARGCVMDPVRVTNATFTLRSSGHSGAYHNLPPMRPPALMMDGLFIPLKSNLVKDAQSFSRKF